MLDIGRQQVQALVAYGRLHRSRIIEELARLLVAGFIVTSVFSGAGAFEAIAAQYRCFLINELGLSQCGPLVCWSTTDIGSLQRKVLKAHKPSSRCRHLFDDVLSRLHEPDRIRLVAIVKKGIWQEVRIMICNVKAVR